jgi:Ion channel
LKMNEFSYYDVKNHLDNNWPVAFQFNYWSSDTNLFQKMTDRWKSESARLSEIAKQIVADNQHWDELLSNYENNKPIEMVEAGGGGESSSQGKTYTYKRDLRGIEITNFEFTKVINAFHYTRLEFCRFENLLLKGQPSKTKIGGDIFFFQNNISFSYFIKCTFTNTWFFEGACKNTVFYDCIFVNVAFNVNSRNIQDYKDIVFFHCKFKKVDFTRIDISSCCFIGCEFEELYFDNEKLFSFTPIGINLIKLFRKWDNKSWPERKTIKSTSYQRFPDGRSKKTVYYYPVGKTRKSRIEQYQTSIFSYEGQLEFYQYIVSFYQAHNYHANQVRAEYVLNWIRDEIELMKKGWIHLPKMLIGRTLLGYGFKPERPLFTWLALVVTFSFCYLYSGLNYSGHIIKRSFDLNLNEIPQTLTEWLKCLYFSVITSTTVGFGDIRPVGGLSLFFAASQSILGLLFFTLFTVVLAKRFFR